MTERGDALDVRYITDSDIPEWSKALDTGFLRPYNEGAADIRRLRVIPARTQGAFDGARCVGTFRSFPSEVTVPGGGTVAASAISNVAVTATHRRRGLLTRMMAEELRASAEREEPVSVLIAAEYGIYGRYGFGQATTSVDYEVDLARAALGPCAPPSEGRLDLVDAAEMLKYGPELYDRFRLTCPGAMPRNERWWQMAAGHLRMPGEPWTEPFRVLYRDASGQVDGLLAYTVDDRWESKVPRDKLNVVELIAATPAAEAELWRYAMSVDWVWTVSAGHRPPDDILPLLLGDPRAVTRTTYADYMWLRPLDVPAILAARAYSAADALVLEVHDRDGYAAGRFLLDGSPVGATCERTTRSADLTLDATALGSLYLGEETATRLAVVGRVEESTANAAGRVDAMFRTGRRPWCPDIF
ncbi:GNAT family N-acetyltransferase [Wenjunlia tyrosinilytica]|uniref:UPF0256 protein n=1 Tax=Wenjunlia tyrosinilytica TaxID=1544741 RepID=A0A918DWS6_9ACTN|nr:GNAT family N-acetyltransferase [Wenjunlia tyrosinilytica]GGO87252.1 UPF0256 protein [Wenjunlia tyrosinilytica]